MNAAAGARLISSGHAVWPLPAGLPCQERDGKREPEDWIGGRGDRTESGLPSEQEERAWSGRGFGATVGRFANANTFLCEAHHHLSVVVNMCILSNKIPLVRLFWAVSVTHFLCCDCSEDRVAVTTVRSPNKIDPQNATVFFFLAHLVLFSPLTLRLQESVPQDS